MSQLHIYIYINSGYIILGVIKVIYTTHLEPTRLTPPLPFPDFLGQKMAWLGARSRFEHFAHALPSTKPGTGGPGTTVNNCPNYVDHFFFPHFWTAVEKKRTTAPRSSEVNSEGSLRRFFFLKKKTIICKGI